MTHSLASLQAEQLTRLQSALQSCSIETAATLRSDRRKIGSYYTPPPLVDFVTRLVLAPWLNAVSGDGTLTILDPAAGDGRFLRRAQAMVRSESAMSTKLFGIERDAASAQLATGLTPTAQIFCAEALLGDTQLPLVDAVIGNPPFLRSIALRRTDPLLWNSLRGQFAATSVGEWDLYGAFLEKSLQWVRPGGRIGFVVPSRWLTAAFARKLRCLLGSYVQSVIDFGSEQVFAGATTYISVVVMERTSEQKSAIVAAHLQENRWSTELVARSAVAHICAPWPLRSRPRWRIGTQTLGDVADIAKGAGTNADRVFIVEKISERCGIATVRGQSHEIFDVESQALAPAWRGRDVVGLNRSGDFDPLNGSATPIRHCIFPYRHGVLIDPHEIQSLWPLASAYFERSRIGLDAREGGRFSGASYYRFGRPQNLQFLLDSRPKVVIPDVTSGGCAIVDRGSLVIDTAYALRSRVKDISTAWIAVLMMSPMIASWLRCTGVPLRGGYFRMKTAYLKTMPLPVVSEQLVESHRAAGQGEFASALAALCAAYEV
jgi:hypothetical protein